VPDILDASLCDPAKHPDEAKGAVYFAGVTRTLSAAGVISNFDVGAEVYERGSDVHLACKYFDQKDFDRRTLPKDRAGYVRAWAKFRAESSFVPELIEHYVEDRVHRIRGTLDRAGPLPGLKGVPWAILEIATGCALPFKRLQTAIYGYMFDPTKVFRRIAVELSADGTFNIIEYPVAEYFPNVHDFLACVRVAGIKRQFHL
jgi:hypothetical protein